MIDTPTLFILGAGASVPYGYPTGLDLRAEIVKYYAKHLQDALEDESDYTNVDRVRYQRDAEEFMGVFRDSSIYSIDKFLSLNPSLAQKGKLSITLNMLEHEKKSQFRELIEKEEYRWQDWYMLLFNRMISTFKNSDDFENFKNNKIAFITFNYDRSLEFFLYDSFTNAFTDQRNKIDEHHKDEGNLSGLFPFPIVHVYGQVGTSGWAANGRTYRLPYNFFDILGLSEGIRVIGERTNGIEDRIDDLFRKYERIFFLGFSYADENLEALGIPDNLTKEHLIFGTTLGLEDREIRKISKKIQGKRGALNIYLEKANSYQLLRKYL